MQNSTTIGNLNVGDENNAMLDFLALIIFVLPVYVANGIPVILGGGARLDLGKNFFDGRPIFGRGKTIRGFVAGVLTGSLVAVIFALIYSLDWFVPEYCGSRIFGFWLSSPARQFIGGIALALGTMIGDASGSFFKRRLAIESGRQFWPDTVVFLAVALLFVYPFVNSSLYSLENMLFLFVLTIILHPGANFIANRLGLKRVPW
jgi:CDP-2,3-bis-(O-geranylgeranyl)-sn-glycerol synthase